MWSKAKTSECVDIVVQELARCDGAAGDRLILLAALESVYLKVKEYVPDETHVVHYTESLFIKALGSLGEVVPSGVCRIGYTVSSEDEHSNGFLFTKWELRHKQGVNPRYAKRVADGINDSAVDTVLRQMDQILKTRRTVIFPRAPAAAPAAAASAAAVSAVSGKKPPMAGTKTLSGFNFIDRDKWMQTLIARRDGSLDRTEARRAIVNAADQAKKLVQQGDYDSMEAAKQGL